MNCTLSNEVFRGRFYDGEVDDIDVWQSFKEAMEGRLGVGQCLLGKKRVSFIRRTLPIPGMDISRSPTYG